MLTYPPLAPPSALPSVPVTMSTRSPTPKCSGVPRPRGPTKPTACESSTITIAPWRSASSQISSSLATKPSIEKTPSVAISVRRAPAACSRHAASSSMSLLAYRRRLALHRRMPSMIEAWLSASEMTTSCSDSSVSNRPPFASKHELNRIVSSVPRNSLRRRSSCLWICLGAADEAHRRHAVAPAVERLMGGLDHRRVIGQAQVVVGAHVDHLGASPTRIGHPAGRRSPARL